jgi:hypothetical protein
VQWPSSVNRTSVSLAVEFLRSNQPLSVGSWWKIRTGPVKPCTPSEKFWWHGKSIMIHSELPAKTYFKQQKFGMLSQPPKVRWESCVWKPHQPIKHVNALLSRRCFLELNHSVGCHSSFNPHMSRLQSQLCWLNSPMFQASMQISHHFWCLDLKFFLVPFSPILYIYISSWLLRNFLPRGIGIPLRERTAFASSLCWPCMVQEFWKNEKGP